MAINKVMRRMLQKYLTPTPLTQEKTPLALQNAIGRKWIVRVGWAPGNYPVYQTTDEGRKILTDRDSVES